MAGAYEALKLTDSVYWVGAVDWGLREFHGYQTGRGTTYNAYLIMADKVTLIDTVKPPFGSEMLSRVASVVDPAKVDCIISNHSEMDHSGCLPEVMAATQPDAVYASPKGVDALNAHFHFEEGTVTAVKEGDVLDLGGTEVTFLDTKLLHWPDSMFTYKPDDGIVFSQDAFGTHLASAERYDDEVPHEALMYEASKYYANILVPFGPLIQKLIAKVTEMNLDIKLLAPDHGPIWRSGIGEIIDRYGTWAAQWKTNKAVLVYDTMWESTHKMARAIGESIQAEGTTVKLMPLKAHHRSDIATEVLDAGAVLVGSPTINAMMFPTVADVLNYLKGLKLKNVVSAAFGSYGWNPAGVKQVNEALIDMKYDVIAEPVKAHYVPDTDELAACVELGKTVAAKVQENCAE